MYNVRKSELSSMLLQGYLPSRLKNKGETEDLMFESERLGTSLGTSIDIRVT